jgi:hypothetical protein
MFYKVGSEVDAATGGKQRPEISVSIYERYALVPPAGGTLLDSSSYFANTRSITGVQIICRVIGSPFSTACPVIPEMQLAISSVWTVLKASPGVLSGSGMSRANTGKQYPAAIMATIRTVLRIGIPSVAYPKIIANLHSFACEVSHIEKDSGNAGREARFSILVLLVDFTLPAGSTRSGSRGHVGDLLGSTRLTRRGDWRIPQAQTFS